MKAVKMDFGDSEASTQGDEIAEPIFVIVECFCGAIEVGLDEGCYRRRGIVKVVWINVRAREK